MVSMWLCVLALPLLAFGDEWVLQQENVCFEATSFGTFNMIQAGTLRSIRLVHKSGSVSCSCNQMRETNFGCGKDLATIITDDKDRVIFPSNMDDNGRYQLPPYTPQSEELVLDNPTSRNSVTKGQEMRIWYGIALKNDMALGICGKSCVDVYVNIPGSSATLIQEAQTIKANELVATLPTLAKGFKMSFDFYPIFMNRWGTVIHLLEDDKFDQEFRPSGSSRYCSLGINDRIPLIFYKASSSNLRVYFNIDGTYKRRDMTLARDTWHSVQISQEKEGTSYRFSVVVNGMTEWSELNSKAQVLSNVKVYTGDEAKTGFPPQKGQLRNLKIENTVRGVYGEWSAWTCSSFKRRRTCSDPSDGGANCAGLGPAEETRTCNANSCPGGYSDWSAWTSCTVSCGGGIQIHTRKCSGVADCSGPGKDQETRICNANSCPVNGGYGDWSAWTKCSVTCGAGSQTHTRTCTNPTPQHGGADCSGLGASQETRSCPANPCPVNGGYTNWSRFSSCNCDGKIVRRRTCTNPRPEHGGRDCSHLGDDENSSACSLSRRPTCAACSNERIEYTNSQNFKKSASKCYTKSPMARFIGYGCWRSGSSNTKTFGPYPTFEECRNRCWEYWNSNMRYNGIYYRPRDGQCLFVKEDTGNYCPGKKEHLNYRTMLAD